jgi:DNA-nicking Smr family endonuclease
VRILKSLGELKAARAEIAKQHEAARLRAHAQALAARAQRQLQNPDHHLFLRAIGAVEPLALRHRTRRVPGPAQLALPEPRQRLADEIQVLTGIGPDVLRRLRRGDWAIQAQLDLHGLRRDQAREQLAAFVRECHRLGRRCVRVVHGKGLGSPGKTPVLKSKVHSWLVQKAQVLAFVQAKPSEGGAGALVVLLAPPARAKNNAQ